MRGRNQRFLERILINIMRGGVYQIINHCIPRLVFNLNIIGQKTLKNFLLSPRINSLSF